MGTGPLFGILVQEKASGPPDNLGLDFINWLQVAGGFAAVGLAIWLLAAALNSLRKPTPPTDPRARPVRLTFPVLVLGSLALVLYVMGWFLHQVSSAEAVTPGAIARTASTAARASDLIFALGGALALAAVSLPFALDLVR